MMAPFLPCTESTQQTSRVRASETQVPLLRASTELPRRRQAVYDIERVRGNAHKGFIVADRSLLRLSATLVVIGEVLFAIVTLFHADGPANNHPVVFAEYARSDD
jgi:hypothetical protein